MAAMTREELEFLKEANAHLERGLRLKKESLQTAGALVEKFKQLPEMTAEQAKFVQDATVQMQLQAEAAGEVTDKLKATDIGLKELGDSAVKTGAAMISALASVESREFKFAAMAGLLAAPITAMKAAVAAIPGELDTNYRQVVKDTGLFSEEMRDLFTYAMDPAAAKRMGIITGEVATPLKNIGITSKESGAALKSLTDNSMLFRKSFIGANMETSIYTANLVAGLGKIGVTADASTKAINQFTKGLKITPGEATKSIKSLVNVADSLEINVGQAMQDFTEMMPQLAQWGEGAIDVFAKLEAQSVATGVGVSDLAGFAQGLDTFEGAANAAQGFNAVMGDTFLSVTDLVHADPADKIAMIQDAMDMAGVSFEEADRRTQQVIASTLGLGDNVLKAQQILGGGAEYAEQAEKIDMASMSQAELEEKITASMTSAELASKSLSSLTSGMQGYVDMTRTAATEGAGLVANMADQIMTSGTKVDDFLGAMAIQASVAGADSKVGKIAVKLLGALGMTTEVLPDLFEGIAPDPGTEGATGAEGAPTGAAAGAAGAGTFTEVPIRINLQNMAGELLGTGEFVQRVQSAVGSGVTGR